VALDIKDNLVDVCQPSVSNRIKEHEAIAVLFGHAQRDSSSTMQLVEVFKTMDGKEFVGAAMVKPIKTVYKLISRLRNVSYRRRRIT